MDVIRFIQFSFNTRYIMRWIAGGLVMFIPGVNFFSIGYLTRASRIFMIGGIGLPTWEDKAGIWMEGVKCVFVFILYEAVPFFLFSCGFFLAKLGSIASFFGTIMVNLFYLAIVVFSFFLPFALVTYSDKQDFHGALEFERIYGAIKEVLVPYAGGYMATMIVLYICKIFLRIPYLVGFALFSVLAYYVLLVATYYFTQLYRRTSLSEVRVTETIEKHEG